MSHVFHRNARAVPPVASHGDGIFVVDTEGNRYLDASGGAAVSCLGHSHPKVTQAIKDQVDKLAFTHTGFFTSQAMEDLADSGIHQNSRGKSHQMHSTSKVVIGLLT